MTNLPIDDIVVPADMHPPGRGKVARECPPYKQLVLGMREHGMRNPVFVRAARDKDFVSGEAVCELVEGYYRLMAAKEAELATVPVVFVKSLKDCQLDRVRVPASTMEV